MGSEHETHIRNVAVSNDPQITISIYITFELSRENLLQIISRRFSAQSSPFLRLRQ
jgi:hypothetical protein